MSYKWRIIKAAVEQEISFPNADVMAAYLDRVEDRGERCQILKQETLSDGRIIAVVRKNYNHNEFFSV